MTSPRPGPNHNPNLSGGSEWAEPSFPQTQAGRNSSDIRESPARHHQRQLRTGRRNPKTDRPPVPAVPQGVHGWATSLIWKITLTGLSLQTECAGGEIKHLDNAMKPFILTVSLCKAMDLVLAFRGEEKPAPGAAGEGQRRPNCSYRPPFSGGYHDRQDHHLRVFLRTYLTTAGEGPGPSPHQEGPARAHIKLLRAPVTWRRPGGTSWGRFYPD